MVKLLWTTLKGIVITIAFGLYSLPLNGWLINYFFDVNIVTYFFPTL